MRYLLLDPIGDYAARQKTFLDRLPLDAIAIFSSKARYGAWEHKWKHSLGHRVVDTFLIDEDDDLKELCAEIDRAYPEGFAGIVPWDELHTVLAAEISELLELNWNLKSVVERFRDKYVMKDHLRRVGGVRINASAIVHNAQEAEAFQEQLGSWPIVVKPTGGAGSMQVVVARNPSELLRGCQVVLEGGWGGVLLEEYIGGQEFAVNGIVDRDGDFLPTDVWAYDKRESHGYSNLYYQSIKVSTGEGPFWQLARYAADVVSAMGLRRSPVHMEVKIDDRGPCLIEVGARMAGGDQPVLASKLHHHSLFELAACHYLSELPSSPRDVDYAHYDHYQARIVSGIQTHEIPQIRAVYGLEQIQELPSFAGIGALRRPGMRVPVTQDLNTKSYEIYLLHPDGRQVEHDQQMVRRLLRYE